jgi:hypothetical protein
MAEKTKLQPKEAATVMDDFLKETESVLYACLLDSGGKRLAEYTASGWKDDAGSLRDSLSRLACEESFERTFIEDELGTIAVCRIPEGLVLITVVEPNLPLGAVSMSAGKLAKELENVV